jgi:hypothetical protein
MQHGDKMLSRDSACSMRLGGQSRPAACTAVATVPGVHMNGLQVSHSSHQCRVLYSQQHFWFLFCVQADSEAGSQVSG